MSETETYEKLMQERAAKAREYDLAEAKARRLVFFAGCALQGMLSNSSVPADMSTARTAWSVALDMEDAAPDEVKESLS